MKFLSESFPSIKTAPHGAVFYITYSTKITAAVRYPRLAGTGCAGCSAAPDGWP